MYILLLQTRTQKQQLVQLKKCLNFTVFINSFEFSMDYLKLLDVILNNNIKSYKPNSEGTASRPSELLSAAD